LQKAAHINIKAFLYNAAFTLNSFGDQERNLRLVKTDFPVLKLKFLACSMKKAFYPFSQTKYCASMAIR